MSQEKIKRYKRATAIKLHINHLISGSHVKDEGNNYIETAFGLPVSRVRILGTIVGKWMPYAKNGAQTDKKPQASLTLDDCTETIRIKAWTEEIKKFEGFEIGDIVDIIGHVREYETEIYITPEIIKKIEDPNWELVRELEIIEFLDKITHQTKLQPISSITQRSDSKDLDTVNPKSKEKGFFKDQIVELINQLDESKGVSLSDLKENIKMAEDDFQDALKELINEGTIYQPSQGRYKIL